MKKVYSALVGPFLRSVPLRKSSSLLPSVRDLKSGRWSRYEQAGTSVVPCFERVRENKKRTVDGTGTARR